MKIEYFSGVVRDGKNTKPPTHDIVRSYKDCRFDCIKYSKDELEVNNRRRKRVDSFEIEAH